MTLTTEQMKKAFPRMVDEYVKSKPCDLTKQDFKDALNAIDDWLELPATKQTINNLFPTNFKNNASVDDKIQILLIVLESKLRG